MKRRDPNSKVQIDAGYVISLLVYCPILLVATAATVVLDVELFLADSREQLVLRLLALAVLLYALAYALFIRGNQWQVIVREFSNASPERKTKLNRRFGFFIGASLSSLAAAVAIAVGAGILKN